MHLAFHSHNITPSVLLVLLKIHESYPRDIVMWPQNVLKYLCVYWTSAADVISVKYYFSVYDSVLQDHVNVTNFMHFLS